MKYLIVKHIIYETYKSEVLTTKDLVELKDRNCEAIIDLENETYFDAKENKWIKIEYKK